MSGLAVSGVADSGVVDGVDTVLEGRRPDVSFEPNRAGCSGSIDEDRTLLRCGEVGMQQWSARTRHCPSAQGRRRITELGNPSLSFPQISILSYPLIEILGCATRGGLVIVGQVTKGNHSILELMFSDSLTPCTMPRRKALGNNIIYRSHSGARTLRCRCQDSAIRALNRSQRGMRPRLSLDNNGKRHNQNH